jgi:ankyrin repeat protein
MYNLLIESLTKNKAIPQELLTHENLNKKSEHGQTHLQTIIAFHKFYEVPKEILTEELLNNIDRQGNNSFHYLAELGDLTETPLKFLTVGNLSKRNSNGENPLHLALKQGYLDLPADVLKLEVLEQKNLKNQTPLEIFFENNTENNAKNLLEQLTHLKWGFIVTNIKNKSPLMIKNLEIEFKRLKINHILLKLEIDKTSKIPT